MDSDILISAEALPDEVRRVCSAINKVARAVIVGGFIRDTLLGLHNNDIDIEVYDQADLHIIEKTLQPFAPIHSVGKSFGVLIFRSGEYHFDVTLARTENKVGIGHKGFAIAPAPYEDFETVALRRDFTINAMGYDTKRERLLDPFGGYFALKEHRLELVHKERFSEDPLRVLRAIGFIARFNLQPSKELIDQCKELLKQRKLLELPKERIYSELEKWLLKASKPSLSYPFITAIHFDLLPDLLANLGENSANRRALFNAIDHATKDPATLWTLLYINLPLKSAISELRSITDDKRLLKSIAIYHDAYHEFVLLHSIRDKAERIYRLKRLALKVRLIKLQEIIAPLDAKASVWLRETAEKEKILEKPLDPLIKGADLVALGLPPSEKFRTLLDAAYDSQLRDPSLSKKELLESLKSLEV